jgi:tocopherol O-methyltransferase
LNEGIKTFYDESSALWESVWGEHMHHGFYDDNNTAKKTRLQAQIDMIENALEFAGVQHPERVLDVGCGIGGSSRCVAHDVGPGSEQVWVFLAAYPLAFC